VPQPPCRFRETGKVVSVDQSGIRYPVVVRFEKVRWWCGRDGGGEGVPAGQHA